MKSLRAIVKFLVLFFSKPSPQPFICRRVYPNECPNEYPP